VNRPQPLPAAEGIKGARERLGSDPAGAAREARAVLDRAPGSAPARLLLGSALRRLGELDEACALLEVLAAEHAAAWGVQFEAGAAWAAQGEALRSIPFLKRARQLNPRSSLARHALCDQLALSGDLASCDRLWETRLPGDPQDPALREAARAYLGGRRAEGEAWLFERFGLHAGDPMAVNLLADAGLREGRLEAVQALTAFWLDRFPRFTALRERHAAALLGQHKLALALEAAEALRRAAPDAPGPMVQEASALTGLGEHDRALVTFEELTARFPDRPELWIARGHVLKTVGRQAEALKAYRQSLALRPSFGDAYWSVANLKVEPFAPSEVETMQALVEQNALGRADRIPLLFALGSAHERAGRFEAAFGCYARAAALHRALHPYDAQAHRDFVRRSQQTFTEPFFADRAGSGDASEAPIFVVGLPRSGSTLVEQILASHSEVEGLSELMELPRLADEAVRVATTKDAYPEALGALPREAFGALGRAYLERARAYRRLARPRFVDKFPGNSLHIGFIHLILPRARIIDVRREPMACCFSLFKQYFADGQAYSYDLDDLGRYYTDYVDLAAHFERTLPGRVHRVLYEDLVADPEGQTRRLLDYCGLGFEPACLTFHETRRPVRTASALQVRRPISREGLEHWRRFEPWLEPLKRGLCAVA